VKWSEPPVSLYDAQAALGSGLNNYVYFAVSIFWRAAAHDWKWNNQTVRRISLGARYQEQCRQFLLDKAELPDSAQLFLYISSETEIGLTTVFPCTTRVQGVHRHKFYIPGLLFTLFLGKRIPETFKQHSLNSRGQQSIWLAPFQNDSLYRGMLKLIKAAPPQGHLKR
jgi:hypothetical protein